MKKTFAAELQIQFIAEKRNKSYKWYDAVSIAGENWIWSRQADGLQAPLVSRQAGA